MSDSESPQLNPIIPKNLYRYHSNVSREIALVHFLNDAHVAPDVFHYGVKKGVTTYDREVTYRMGKKQELEVVEF